MEDVGMLPGKNCLIYLGAGRYGRGGSRFFQQCSLSEETFVKLEATALGYVLCNQKVQEMPGPVYMILKGTEILGVVGELHPGFLLHSA